MEHYKKAVEVYLTKGVDGLLDKSNFGNESTDSAVAGAFMLMILLVITLPLILGIVAVNKIIVGTTQKATNIRIALILVLLFTKAQVGWVYVLLWLSGFKIQM